MKWLDRLFSSPAPAPAPRQSMRQELPPQLQRFVDSELQRLQRSFDAGNLDRLNSSWTSTPLSIDQVIRDLRVRLVARARDQYRRNDYVKGFVSLLQNNVVGPEGFELQSRPRYPDGTLDTTASRAIEDAWKAFAAPGACDFQGQLSLLDMQRLYIAAMCTDGEPIVRFHMGPDVGPHGIALELIDSLLVPTYLNRDLGDGFRIRAGIQYDRRGRRTAYYIRTAEDRDGLLWHEGNKFEPVPANLILHDFLPTEIGQKRGLPWVATSLNRLKHIDGYIEAAQTAARIGAAKVAWIKSNDGEYDGSVGADRDGAPTMTAEPGEFGLLRADEELVDWDPTYPSGEFSDFVKRCLQGICAGLGLQYSAVSKDHGDENYSSMMAGRIEDRDVYEALQKRMALHFVGPIFDRWLRIALTGGHIAVGETAMPFARYEKFRAVTWRTKRWRSIDPVKDATARQIDRHNGVASLSQQIRDTGEDPDEVIDEIARDQATLEAKNVRLPDGPQLVVHVGDPKEGPDQ